MSSFALEHHRRRMWEAQRAGDATRLYMEAVLFATFYWCLSRMAVVLGEPECDPFERLDPVFEGSIDEERARGVIRAYFEEVRRAPDLWLITAEYLLADPRVGEMERERTVAALTGRVRAITTHGRMRGLRAGLDREGKDLLEEWRETSWSRRVSGAFRRMGLPDKTCPVCGRPFNRKRYGRRLDDRGAYGLHKHCSRPCVGVASSRDQKASRTSAPVGEEGGA